MKKKILFFFVAVLSITAFSFMNSAADAPDPLPVKTGTVSTESAYGTSKRAALEAANVKVENGETPDHIEYFADGTKYRTIEDGYYTITPVGTDMCFNVNSDGANSDYEGIHITVWPVTDDVTQRFRLVMNDDGTYSFYAACSRGGYSRAVGYDEKTGTVGLYSADSPHAATFYIRNSESGDGSKILVLSTDESKVLGCFAEAFSGEDVFLGEYGTEGIIFDWKFETWGKTGNFGGEKAMYPADMLLVTQGPFDIYSHQNQNATDVQVAKGDSLFAPFTCEVVAINEACGNVVYIQSVSKVLFADGSYDYMTCLFMHDNDISDIYIGEIILQGQDFYEMGTAGFTMGEHVHISCYRGEYSKSMKVDNTDDNAVNIWDAFFVPEDITVRDDYGMAWVYDN